MPQALLPLVPDGATTINDRISLVRENGEWTYFYGVDPIFRHPETDRSSFRMFTAQLICQGACRQSDLGPNDSMKSPVMTSGIAGDCR